MAIAVLRILVVARALLFVAGIRLLLLFFTFVAAIAINLATPYASV